jgi:hypothetical protein
VGIGQDDIWPTRPNAVQGVFTGVDDHAGMTLFAQAVRQFLGVVGILLHDQNKSSFTHIVFMIDS